MKARVQIVDNSGRVTMTPSGYSIISEKVDEMMMAANLMEDELRQAKNKYVSPNSLLAYPHINVYTELLHL